MVVGFFLLDVLVVRDTKTNSEPLTKHLKLLEGLGIDMVSNTLKKNDRKFNPCHSHFSE